MILGFIGLNFLRSFLALLLKKSIFSIQFLFKVVNIEKVSVEKIIKHVKLKQE